MNNYNDLGFIEEPTSKQSVKTDDYSDLGFVDDSVNKPAPVRNNTNNPEFKADRKRLDDYVKNNYKGDPLQLKNWLKSDENAVNIQKDISTRWNLPNEYNINNNQQKPVQQSKVLTGQVEKTFTPDEKKYLVKDPSQAFKKQIDDIERQGNIEKAKIIGGGTVKTLSPLVGLGLAPVTGGMSLPASMALTGGLEGLTYGLGDTVMKNLDGKKAVKNTLTEGALGAGTGAGLGATFKYLPQITKAIKGNKTLKEAGKLAVNPQKYVADIKPPVNPVQLPDNTAGYLPELQKTNPMQTIDNINNQLPEFAGGQPPIKPPIKTMIGSADIQPPAIANNIIPVTSADGGGIVPPIKPPAIIDDMADLPINTGSANIEDFAHQGEIVKPNQKVRKTYESLEGSKFGDDTEFMGNIEPNKMYDTVNNADTFKQAMNLNNAEADQIIKSSDPSALRTMATIKKLGDALDSQDQIAAEELGNLILKRGTQEGQSIQALSLIKKLSPEGAVLTMLKVSRDSIPEHALKLIDNAEEVVNGVNNAKSQTINSLMNDDPSIRWNFVVNKLGEKLAKKVNTHITPEIEKTMSPVEQVIKTLYSVAKEELPKRGKKAPDDLLAFVRNALQNKQLYGQTYNKAQQIIANKYANNPEKLQILNKYLSELKENPYSQDYVNKITSDLMKNQNIKIKDLVKAHVSKEDFTAQSLKKDLIQKLGIDEQTASRFSLATQKRFYNQLNEARNKALEQYFKDVPPIQKKAIYNKIVELSNMGALDSNKYIKEISKKFKAPELTADDITKAKELAAKIQTTTGRENDVAIGELKKLIGSKRKIEVGQKIKAARNINLLLSSTGRLADTISTGLFQGQEALAELATGQRLHPKEWTEGLLNGIKYGIDDVKRGIDTSRISATDAYDLPYGQVLGDVPIYNKAEKALNYMIRVPDRAFEEARYASSLAEQMRVAKISEPTEEMIQNAIIDAKNSTFKGESISSDIAQGLQKVGNRISYKGIGLGDFQIPFAKTLGNIGEESLKYTPLNFSTALYDYLKGNPRSARMNLGKSIVGTGTVAGGVGLAAYKDHTGSLPDKDIRANNQALGKQPHSINTPIGNIQYSRILPLSNQLAFGEGLYTGWKGGDTLQDKMIGAFGGGAGSLIDNQLESPYLKGTKTFLDNMTEVHRAKGAEEKGQKIADTFGETLTNYGTQMLPFSSTANNINKANIPFISDPYARQVDYTNLAESAMSRYPFTSRFLPNKKNVLGENIKVNNTDIPFVSQAEGLLNPFNIENVKDNQNINRSLELNEPLPVVKNRVKINGKMKKLTSSEVSKYQETTGKLLNEELNEVYSSEYFNSLPSVEQSKIVKDIQSDINSAILYKFFGNRPKKGLDNYAEKYLDRL